MNRKNHNRIPYLTERREPPTSNGYGRSPPPSHRRPKPSPSYNYSNSPPSHRRPKPSTSYNYSNSPTSHRRPKPSPSYYYSNSSSSQRKPTPSLSYYNVYSPSLSHENERSRKNKKQKISIGAFFIIMTTLGLYGAFFIFNQTPPVNNGINTPPSVNIISPSDGSVITSSTVLISWNGSASQSSIKYYEIQIDYGSWINKGNSSSHTFSGLSDGSHTVVVRAWDTNDNSNTESISFTVDTSNVEKIAAFFWASDAGAQWVIDEYINVLQNEGYTKFFDFEDTYNFQAEFQQIANYEDSDDIIFFYLFGHGNNNGQHSYTAFAPSSSIVYSNEFRDMCDTLDSSRVGILVESCHSGDWADDMRGGGYLAMSTSDETHLSYAEGPLPNEGIFTNAFFNEVANGSDAIDAFSAGESVASYQYPKLCDESSHYFFA